MTRPIDSDPQWEQLVDTESELADPAAAARGTHLRQLTVGKGGWPGSGQPAHALLPAWLWPQL